MSDLGTLLNDQIIKKALQVQNATEAFVTAYSAITYGMKVPDPTQSDPNVQIDLLSQANKDKYKAAADTTIALLPILVNQLKTLYQAL